MLCQHLFSSLFQSSLPYPSAAEEHTASPEELQQWGSALAVHLDSYVTLYAERLSAKREFVTMLNGKLSKLHLYDRRAIEAQYAELQAAYAAADQAALERRERGEEKVILTDCESIRAFLREDAQNLVDGCPTLAEQSNMDAEIMQASAYAVFEALLIQYDRDVLFNYEMDSETVFDFFMNPAFPVTTEDIRKQLVLRNIVEFKTYIASYAEMIDTLFTKFSGREYIFSNVSMLVEYFLDVMGYTYAFSYAKFLRHPETSILGKIPNFPKLFEFHFFNFLSNLEHMRCSMHAFLNKDTMHMLAAMVGQFNVLERHDKRDQLLEKRQEEFRQVIDKLWHSHTGIGDHVAMLAYLESAKAKKMRDLCQLFGKARTKNLVAEVLKKYNAVRGIPGFAKRTSSSVK